jgi:microcystin-dependent protein
MDEYIGAIKMFIGDWAPDGYLMCQGQELQIGQNQALFALIGTRYGGDGVRTFKLPDLRSRFPMGMGQGLGLTQRNLGAFGGVENVILTTDQIPAHSHAVSGGIKIKVGDKIGDASAANGNVLAFRAGDVETSANLEIYNKAATATFANNNTLGGVESTIALATTGGSKEHTNMPPFVVVNYIIDILNSNCLYYRVRVRTLQ